MFVIILILLILTVPAIILIFRRVDSDKIISAYKDSPESKSVFVKKYPQADLEHQRNLFLKFGLIFSLGFVLLAFSWTKYDKTEANLGALVIEDDIEIEPPQTKPERPPPPPPPPPKLDIVESEEEVEEEPEILEMDVDEETEIVIPEVEEEVIDESEVFMIVEEMPEFPGGPAALQKYLQSAEFPPIAIENNIEGTVWIYFVVDQNGNVTDAKVARGVDPSLDRSALKHVKAMPKWTPGKQRGKPVKVSYNVRIVFKLL